MSTEAFVFSEPMNDPDDLNEWRDWFMKKGICSWIRKREDGRYDLIREGKERPTDMPCEPVMGPCKHCGKQPPHDEGFYIFCDDMCRQAEYMVQRRNNDKEAEEGKGPVGGYKN